MGGTRALQMTPLVVDGVMYAAAVNEVRALDARTGSQIWQFARPQTPGLVPTGDAAAGINRAIAVLGDRIFLQTDHAHLLALDRRNGQVIWDVEMADYRQNYGSTGAAARRQRSRHRRHFCGRRRRSWLPGRLSGIHRRTRVAFLDGACARRTWIGDVDRKGARARLRDHWLTGSYDPEARLLYWPTGNPCPDYNGEERKGDNLTRPPLSLSIPQPGSCDGTSSSRRTIFTTGMRISRRCSSMPTFADVRASCSSSPTATDSSTSSIGSRAGC